MCAAHTDKSCYTGSADGYGCPWLLYPGALTKNTYCGTCMECLRTCPHDNIAFNLRSFGADLINPPVANSTRPSKLSSCWARR